MPRSACSENKDCYVPGTVCDVQGTKKCREFVQNIACTLTTKTHNFLLKHKKTRNNMIQMIK
jgi:hypothetical protein